MKRSLSQINLPANLKITKQVKNAIRTGYTWPGGYQLAIVMNDGGMICPDCGKKEWKQIAHDTLKEWKTGWDAAGVEVCYSTENDDEKISCSHCNCDLTA